MATTLRGNSVHLDPKDYRGIIALMSRADEFDVPLVGTNREGERVLISINSDNVTTETFQTNNWCRENIYWKDGTTEELFHRC